MSELDISKILKMFDVFLTLLENPTIGEQTNTENVIKAFQCARFIEAAIAKASELDKETVLESHLHKYWLKERRSILYNYSELKNACDKLLEVYLKDNTIPTEIVDELLKCYTQHCGTDRLNEFFKCTVINGICTNIVIESLEELGIPSSDMLDEALIMSWEAFVGNGKSYEVSECIHKMYLDGCVLKLVRFAANLDDEIKAKKLIVQFLSSKIAENDASVCLAFLNIKNVLLWKLIQSNSEFYLNFLDALFYFARHMKLVEQNWTSKYEFEYKHLLQMVKTLLNVPCEIAETIYKRVQLVKAQPNGAIWHDIEKDIGIPW